MTKLKVPKSEGDGFNHEEESLVSEKEKVKFWVWIVED